MNKIGKKLCILLTAGALAVSALTLSACDYRAKGYDDAPAASAEVSSQGGWVVKKGGWVYFLNGVATAGTDADGNALAYENEYGKVTRGALMRIKESDMAGAGDYAEKAEVVVPLVVSSSDYKAGFFIYGDRVYYATPSTAKNLQGETESDYVDFKSSTLDGKKTMKNYYCRAASSAEYRFVEVNGTVYLLHFENADLYSYNTSTGKDVLLAKNTSSHLFDSQDRANPYVYYTMSVTEDVDKTNSVAQKYTQVYRVRADAEYTLSSKKSDGTRTVSAEGFYDDYTTTTDDAGAPCYRYEFTFDVDSLDRIADDADEGTTQAEFSSGDVATYPYFNIGQLIFDGVGSKDDKTMFSHSVSTPYSPAGYTYSLVEYKESRLYYTRTYVDKTGSSGDDGWTFCFDETAMTAQNGSSVAISKNEEERWDSVAANADTTRADFGGYNDLIAKVSTNANSSAWFYQKGGENFFLYTDGSTITRVQVGADGSEQNKMTVARGGNTSVSSFLMTDDRGTYKYVYYLTGTNGVGRAVYDSDEAGYGQDSYHQITGDEEYYPVNILCNGDNSLGFTHATDWYAPEIVGDKIYFIDGTTIGDSAAGTAQVISLRNGAGEVMTNAEIAALNDKLEDVSDLFETATEVNLYNPLFYYYYTGESSLFATVISEAVKAGNTSTYVFSQRQQDFFNGYVSRKGSFTVNAHKSVDFATALTDDDEYYGVRSYFFHTIGVLDADEEDARENAWRVSYLNGSAIDESTQPWTYAVIGIAIGAGVIGLLSLLAIPAVILIRNANARKAARAAAGGKRKKYTVDMSDNSDIDVYAPDEPAESAETPSEEE